MTEHFGMKRCFFSAAKVVILKGFGFSRIDRCYADSPKMQSVARCLLPLKFLPIFVILKANNYFQ